jgi:nucleotide-binding universal stress UspA family protein
MNPFRKILVPVDFGGEVRRAIRMAAGLARRDEASVELFHVWQPPALLPGPVMVLPSEGGRAQLASEVAQGIARARLDELVDELHREGVQKVRCHVGVGDPAHEICALTSKGGYDLVVMATHARTGIQHALLGSVTERVLRHCDRPVLVVRGTDPA